LREIPVTRRTTAARYPAPHARRRPELARDQSWFLRVEKLEFPDRWSLGALQDVQADTLAGDGREGHLAAFAVGFAAVEGFPTAFLPDQ
jgi:hypothetical protein